MPEGCENVNIGEPIAIVVENKEDIPALVENSSFDVLVTLGAGDIEDYATCIQEIVKNKV